MHTRTIALTLKPTDTERAALVALRSAFADACNAISATAWEEQTFRLVPLHHLVYRDVRSRFGLPAQYAVRAIGGVVNSYKVDKGRQHVFRRNGAVALDTPRLYRVAHNRASITTLSGRVSIQLGIGGHQRLQIANAVKLAEADLVCDRKGRWRLLVSAHFADPTPVETNEVIGMDLGRTDIAVTSDGEAFSGKKVTEVRDRYARTRQMIQHNVSQGTRSSRRRGRAVLARLAGRERRFQAHTNHTISRRIVNDAATTARAIAVEDLTGIRERTNTQPRCKTERRRSNSWAFAQLRSFLTYKAADAGIPLVAVTPRYTSQMCCRCLWMGERRGKRFHCNNPSCQWSGDSDYNGACNIALLGRSVITPRGSYPSCSIERGGRRASESCLL